MGLADLFKKNYAKEFREAFENGDFENLHIIVQKWLEKSSDDANLTLAMVILGCASQNVEFTKTFEMYLSASDETPADPSLSDWFNSKAIEMMEKRTNEDIGFDEMFNNRYKSKSASNDYVEKFLNLLESIIDCNGGSVDEMRSLLKKWGEECPDDANMHCAYVILNAVKSSKDEIDEHVKKAKECSPGDKNSYAKLLALMYKIIEQRGL